MDEKKKSILEKFLSTAREKYYCTKEESMSVERLDLFNKKPEEPKSSVMESSDYDFAIAKYNNQDFRYKFVRKYAEIMRIEYGIEVYNCKFERPRDDSKFVNFYVYVWENDPDVNYRVDDTNNRFYLAFVKSMSKISINGLNQKSRVQVILKNINNVMYGKILDNVWHDINKTIQVKFPKVNMLSYWSNLYLFISDEQYNKIFDNMDRLQMIKKYCYEVALKYDVHKILDYDKFKIRVDNIENYRSIGGQHYFNSDYMFDCPLI
jgi:hypothetical protein